GICGGGDHAIYERIRRRRQPRQSSPCVKWPVPVAVSLGRFAQREREYLLAVENQFRISNFLRGLPHDLQVFVAISAPLQRGCSVMWVAATMGSPTADIRASAMACGCGSRPSFLMVISYAATRVAAIT